MKTPVLSLFLLCASLYAQVNFDYFLNSNTLYPSKISLPKDTNTFVLNASFNEDLAKVKTSLDQYKYQQLVKVQLIYTQYRLSSTFNQRALNRKRIQSLYKALPQALDNRVEWELIEQTACQSPEEGRTYFHGFILHFSPLPSEEEIEAEIDFLDEFIKDLEPRKDSVSISKAIYDSLIESGSTDSFKIDIVSKWHDVLGYVYDTLYTKYLRHEPKWSAKDLNLPDTTVYTIFNRNTDWNNIVIVSDVTASMSKYTAQLMTWYKKQIDSNQVDEFVFFNDGNRKANALKRISKTGGIYRTKATDFKTVAKVMKETMMRGTGGDIQENDVEALIEAQLLCRDSSELILIADNISDMRDFDLFMQLNRPVRIIICGNPNAINVQYLELARRTKGSIHTVENDVYDLHILENEDEIRIGDAIYEIYQNFFRSVYVSN